MKNYLKENYITFRAKSDLYCCFVEKGINLLKFGGLLSFILPHNWTSLESFYFLRKFILDNCKIIKLVQLPKKVFEDASIETCIILVMKEKDIKKRERNEIIIEKLNENGQVTAIRKYFQKEINNNHLCNFGLYIDSSNDILNKVKNIGVKLETLVDFSYGLKTGDDNKFIFKNNLKEDYKKILRSKDIFRYYSYICLQIHRVFISLAFES